MQPASVREEDTIAVKELNFESENVVRGDQDEDSLKKSAKIASNLVEADSTSNQDKDGETEPNQYRHTGSQFIPTSSTYIPCESQQRSSLTPQPPPYTYTPTIEQFNNNLFSTSVPYDPDFS